MEVLTKKRFHATAQHCASVFLGGGLQTGTRWSELESEHDRLPSPFEVEATLFCLALRMAGSSEFGSVCPYSCPACGATTGLEATYLCGNYEGCPSLG